MDRLDISGPLVEKNEGFRHERDFARMKSLFHVVRNINRLILCEREVERLVCKICEIFVQAQWCAGAILILSDESGSPVRWTQAGFGKSFDGFAEALKSGKWPDCSQAVPASNRCSTMRRRVESCTTCPLSDRSGCSVVSRLVCNGEELGLIIVSFRRDEDILAGELDLIAEAAEDIALALASARAEKKRIQDEKERALVQANFAQSDRLAAMDMLAAGVAHEINNPLSYILYNLESLIEDLPGLLNALGRFHGRFDTTGLTGSQFAALSAEAANPVFIEDIIGRLKDAYEGSLRIREVVRGLCVFSKIEKRKFEQVDLTDVIDMAVCVTYKEIRHRARLVKEHEVVPPVSAAEGRLLQVFLNLIVNVAQHMSEADMHRNEIRIRTWFEDGFVCTEVSDNGNGIAQEDVEKVFEPFFNAGTLGRGFGFGFGLAVTKSIVEDLGGAIDVGSETDRGCSFIVRLPACSEKEYVKKKPMTSGSPPIARGRILIVDDEDRIRTAIRRMLQEHEIVPAASGAEARDLLQRDRSFDLILCDMIMPGVSGMELHEWLLKKDPELAERVIFITGGAFTRCSREYLKRVENTRIEKPFEAAELKNLVYERLNRAGEIKSVQ